MQTQVPHKREADVTAAGGDLPTKHDAVVLALRTKERAMRHGSQL